MTSSNALYTKTPWIYKGEIKTETVSGTQKFFAKTQNYVQASSGFRLFGSWPTRLKIMRNISAALEYMHSEGYIHRDLTSSNLLVTDGYEAKVSPSEGQMIICCHFIRLEASSICRHSTLQYFSDRLYGERPFLLGGKCNDVEPGGTGSGFQPVQSSSRGDGAKFGSYALTGVGCTREAEWAAAVQWQSC